MLSPPTLERALFRKLDSLNRLAAPLLLNTQVLPSSNAAFAPCSASKRPKTAYATLKGIEVMRMMRKLQCILLKPGIAAEVRFFNKLFGVYS